MTVPYKWRALSVTSLGSLLSVLDGSIFIIALPSIMRDLNASFIIITWVIMGYLFVVTILTPTFGRIADMIGRKKMYLWGFVLFTLASLFCATSQTGQELLVFRMIQAVGGSMIIANGIAIITDAFPKQELGTAMGISTTIFGVGAAIGPVLGGFLLFFGWRIIFFVNIPTGVLGTIWGYFQLKEVVKMPAKQKFDAKGMVAFAVGMVGILIVLSFGGSIGWNSPVILTLLVVGVTFILIFIRIEAKAKFPMMDLELFRSSRLAYGYLSALFNAIARGAVTFLLTFYLQVILDLDPIHAAIYLTPFAIAQSVGSPISGRLSDRHGSQRIAAFGLLLSNIGVFGMIFIAQDTPPLLLVLWMSIMGFGSGLFFSPNAKIIMQEVPPYKRGIATSVRSMMFNVGTVVSMGLALAILSSDMSTTMMQNLFLGIASGTSGIAVPDFINGLRLIFLISFIVSLMAAYMSARKGKAPVWKPIETIEPEMEMPGVQAEEFGI
jgi:EmrB/QacA subfamily drug resistance transporter